MSDAADKLENLHEKPGAYQPKQDEIDAAKRILKRREKLPRTPRFKVSHPKGKVTIEPDHADSGCAHILLADMLATGDSTLAEGILVQLANAAHSGKELAAGDLNVMVATVGAIGPRDATEALLASQMAAIHTLTMVAARRLHRCETIAQQDSASNMVNKLARTFAGQIEALKRYRSSGEQNIRVQHVTVNEGGQAIVGNVDTGGGGCGKNQSQSHAPSEGEANECRPALPSDQQAIWSALPITGCEGATSLPDAWRQGGSTEGQG